MNKIVAASAFMWVASVIVVSLARMSSPTKLVDRTNRTVECDGGYEVERGTKVIDGERATAWDICIHGRWVELSVKQDRVFTVTRGQESR